MKKAVAAFLVLAACGGGSSEFDEDAVRANLERRYPSGRAAAIDEVVEAQRDMCEGSDDEFKYVVAIKVDDGTVGDLLIACPERTEKVLQTLD